MRNKERKFDKGEFGAIILGVIGIAGVLTVALAAPNIIQVVKLFQKKKNRRYHSPKYIRTVVDKMIRQGYVILKKRNGEEVLSLTEKGKYALSKFQLKQKSLEKPKKWDRKWRIIVFDIEEKRRATRDRIRENIQEYGFVKLQQSVWVYPYECEELITFFKAECKIGKELLYIVANEIEGEDHLKKKFRLI